MGETGKLRLVALVIVCVSIVGLFVPWAHVELPHVGSVFGFMPASSADIGLLRCIRGDLCDMFNSVHSDAKFSAWMKDNLAATSMADNVVTANKVTVSLLGMCLTSAVLLELSWWCNWRPQLRGVDMRTFLSVLSSTFLLFSGLVYMALMQDSLHQGAFDVGVFLTIGFGVLCSVISMSILFSSMGDEEQRPKLLPYSSRVYRKVPGYGT
mmetsp:Transcript_14236/g.26376  ORF Transcript_14236/g.26376 Transcript_14236/m.26376 type:complete len:210 (+) Transcript_14236:111-740(+)